MIDCIFTSHIETGDRLDVAEKSFESFFETTKGNAVRTILCIDGGDFVTHLMDSFPWHHIIINTTALGVSMCINQALSFIRTRDAYYVKDTRNDYDTKKPDFISIHNDDVEYKEDWMWKCEYALSTHFESKGYFPRYVSAYMNLPKGNPEIFLENGFSGRHYLAGVHFMGRANMILSHPPIPQFYNTGVERGNPSPGFGSRSDWWFMKDSECAPEKTGGYCVCFDGATHIGGTTSTWQGN